MTENRKTNFRFEPKYASLTAGLVGLVAGLLIMLLFVALPQQRTIMKKDDLVTRMAEFNREEQERLAEMRDVSEAQLHKWVSINEEAARKYGELLHALQKREQLYANPGLYWTTLVLVLLCVIIGFYIWASRTENLKDVTTLRNFEAFVEQRLKHVPTMDLLAAAPPSRLAREKPEADLPAD